ncbi:fructokinase [Saccharopolyspora kobensis]|uniref:Fructokinase n=1 Tax=Saccharopolyspora kobensis TaxID=146035 RepID=A0A1H6D6D0_9PSEU|nr:carbohydrate kinase [Saccharopolyspora kobensis]SEG80842.1 fructokinase [Saccharopolyspora kobensis]SFD13394.1 fructokinase [Saccharopolyspora kobensis]
MIVIGGEALVDLVPDPATGEGELGPLHPLLGGGPYNVAIALGRLGVPAAFYARVSTDQFGDKLVERLRASNVDTGLVQRGPEPTTLAVVGLGEDGSARYSFHTEGTATRFVTDQELPERTTALCLGTLGMVLEPGASVYEKVLFREAERGRFIALDPNIRADLIADPDAYRARFRSWLPSVGLLKVSDDDAGWLADGGDVLDAARDWQREGPAAVVLTRGADGLTAVTAAGEITVPGERVEVADTIGAGDTVQAALLAWLHRNGALSANAVRRLDREQWERALRFAAAAAAVTVSRAGAEPPWAGELTAD